MENKIICMRGHAERTHEVRSFFIKNKVQETCEYSFNIEDCIYYIDPVTEGVKVAYEGDRAYNNLLPHLTELPPLEEKVEEVEFWLKPFDKVVVRGSVATSWHIDLFQNKTKHNYATMTCLAHECLPFNAETEKLLGTYGEPNTKYIFKGVKSYFDEE